MKISVVTVCFNSARTIRHTVESFLAQSHPDKELIIVDGASRDATLDVVGALATDDVRIVSAPDDGIYDAMNKGLGLYAGDAVGFLNSDDRFKDEHALAHIAAALDDADISFGDLDFVGDHETAEVVRRWRSTRYSRGAFASGWMPPHPTFYVRRAVVDAVGRFDTSFRIAADYDFMLRAMELHDFRAHRIDRVLIDMMQGGDSTSGLKAYVTSNFESLRSRQRWLNAGPLDRALVAKPLRKLGQFLVVR
jgi:glycosyltransferase involved in cell wall biosynthesis